MCSREEKASTATRSKKYQDIINKAEKATGIRRKVILDLRNEGNWLKEFCPKVGGFGSLCLLGDTKVR